jgi:hypothetical protein
VEDGEWVGPLDKRENGVLIARLEHVPGVMLTHLDL